VGDDRRMPVRSSQGADCHYHDEINPITRRDSSPTRRQRNLTIARRDPARQPPAPIPPKLRHRRAAPGRTSRASPRCWRGTDPARARIPGPGQSPGRRSNQRATDTKRLTLGCDAPVDVGKERASTRPTRARTRRSASGAITRCLWSTAVLKRFPPFEPYFGGWDLLPVRTKRSQFPKMGTNQTTVDPQQRAGVQIASSSRVGETPNRAGVTVRGARCEGTSLLRPQPQRAWWEALSGSPQCANDATKCRSDPSHTAEPFGIDTMRDAAAPSLASQRPRSNRPSAATTALNIQVAARRSAGRSA